MRSSSPSFNTVSRVTETVEKTPASVTGSTIRDEDVEAVNVEFCSSGAIITGFGFMDEAWTQEVKDLVLFVHGLRKEGLIQLNLPRIKLTVL